MAVCWEVLWEHWLPPSFTPAFGCCSRLSPSVVPSGKALEGYAASFKAVAMADPRQQVLEYATFTLVRASVDSRIGPVCRSIQRPFTPCCGMELWLLS